MGAVRSSVELRLREAGIALRSQSEAERLKWSRMAPDTRAAQLSAAHTAARGRKATLAERTLRARTVEREQIQTTEAERTLRGMLDERGIIAIPQKAVGPYNCDLGAFPVAVEIFGGDWHFSGRHLARAPKRLRYLMDRGWSVLMVQITERYPLDAAVADYVANFIHAARGEPASRREYRVIRGAGETLAAGRSDDHEISIVPALRNMRDKGAGGYEAISR